jgi:hypothetical protein
VIYTQWRLMGAPFNAAEHELGAAVVDPDALLWCSLAFVDRQPRLAEAIDTWLIQSPQTFSKPRITAWSRHSPDRKRIWESFQSKPRSLREDLHYVPGASGRLPAGPATLLLRARAILGLDARHLLIVYLLAQPGGARLKKVSEWAGYSYRRLAQIAEALQTVGAVTFEGGFCALKRPHIWSQLLDAPSQPPLLIRWHAVFESVIDLLQFVSKAESRGLDAGSDAIASQVRQANEAFDDAVIRVAASRAWSNTQLCRVVASWA